MSAKRSTDAISSIVRPPFSGHVCIERCNLGRNDRARRSRQFCVLVAGAFALFRSPRWPSEVMPPRNRDLIIARDYITQGMRERAAEIVTFDLGERSDVEIENAASRIHPCD